MSGCGIEYLGRKTGGMADRRTTNDSSVRVRSDEKWYTFDKKWDFHWRCGGV